MDKSKWICYWVEFLFLYFTLFFSIIYSYHTYCQSIDFDLVVNLGVE